MGKKTVGLGNAMLMVLKMLVPLELFQTRSESLEENWCLLRKRSQLDKDMMQ